VFTSIPLKISLLQMNYTEAWKACCKLGMNLLSVDDNLELQCLAEWNNDGQYRAPGEPEQQIKSFTLQLWKWATQMNGGSQARPQLDAKTDTISVLSLVASTRPRFWKIALYGKLSIFKIADNALSCAHRVNGEGKGETGDTTLFIKMSVGQPVRYMDSSNSTLAFAICEVNIIDPIFIYMISHAANGLDI
jgi:hypothetical protein